MIWEYNEIINYSEMDSSSVICLLLVFKYVLILILYFYLSNILYAGLLLVTEYFYTVVLVKDLSTSSIDRCFYSYTNVFSRENDVSVHKTFSHMHRIQYVHSCKTLLHIHTSDTRYWMHFFPCTQKVICITSFYIRKYIWLLRAPITKSWKPTFKIRYTSISISNKNVWKSLLSWSSVELFHIILGCFIIHL